MEHKDYKCYLIDLDGTIYRGSDTIESGVRFIHRLQEKNIPHLFLTNNSTRTPQMVVDKLRGHGVNTDIYHIYTPVLATESYLLAQNPDTAKIPVYIIGQTGLVQGLLKNERFYYDDRNPKYVVVGMDTDLTYHKIRVATRSIRNGATFIGTNADKNLPSGDELLPGNGALCTMLEVATGVKPIYIGKPSSIIVASALKMLNAQGKDAMLVGDNYDTDIMAGVNCNIDSLLTLTGVTTKKQLAERDKQPTYVVENLDEWKL